MQTKPKAVVLLSGGLDSTTVLALAASEGYEVYALSFRYGQRHDVELRAAERAAAHVGITRHAIVDLDLRAIGGSALTDDIPVPKGRDARAMANEIPVTYVPARNTIFLSVALGWAEALGAGDIFLGVNARDYSGYPDCRPEFIEAFERLARLATKAGVEGRPVRIRTPLLHLDKRQIVQLGQRLGVDWSLTTSCYDPAPDGAACGECDACVLRLRGFEEAGVADPIRYRAGTRAPRAAPHETARASRAGGEPEADPPAAGPRP